MDPRKRKKMGRITVIIISLAVALICSFGCADGKEKGKSEHDFRYRYQVDMDDPELKNDTFTLISDDYSWEYSLCLKDLEEVEEDWVLMTFPNPPKRKTYSLIHTPEGSEQSYYIFDGLPYDSLQFDVKSSLDSELFNESSPPY